MMQKSQIRYLGDTLGAGGGIVLSSPSGAVEPIAEAAIDPEVLIKHEQQWQL